MTKQAHRGKTREESIRWSILLACREFGWKRERLTQRIRTLAIEPGDDDCFSTQQMASVILGDKESETVGKIAADRKKIETEVETMKKERIPVEVVNSVNAEAFGAIAAILKAHKGKMLTDETISDIQSSLRDIPHKLKWTK